MPRAQNLTIFDEFVPPSTTVYTSTDFNAKLGQHNQIAIHAVVDNVSAAVTLDIWCEQSADGRVWVQRNTLAGGTAEINWPAGGLLSTTAVNSKFWSDACDSVSKDTVAIVGPLLAFVRFKIVIGAGSAHIRLYATLRDR